MSKAAVSLYVFGIYVIITGIILLVVPNFMLSLFGMPGTEEIWIRIVGALAAVIGYYYLRAAKKELTDFFRWTTHTRPLVIVLFGVFAALGMVKPVLVLFGVIDLLGAIWTWRALMPSLNNESISAG